MELTLTKDSRFWDKIADKYAKRPIADQDAYEEKLRLTRQHLDPDMRLLEFGCGTGGTALCHAPYVKEVHATDVSPRMIEIAEDKRWDASVGNVRFSVADLHSFSANDVRYDAVLAMSLLHLVSDRDVALMKIRSLLRPGDLFVSSTMCIGDDLKFFKLIAPIGKAFGLFPTLRVFTSDELCVSIEDSGFDIVQRWKPGRAKATFVIAKAL